MNNEAVDPLWSVEVGDGPLMAVAIHAGHEVRGQVSGLLAVSEADRLREEDPYTDIWARLADTWVIAKQSRFEMDLNRPRKKAVYIVPEDAWGLKVWKRPPPKAVVKQSLAQYDAFIFA